MIQISNFLSTLGRLAAARKSSAMGGATAFALALGVSTPALAQDAERAVEAFQAGSFEDAANQFFGVMEFSDDDGDVAEAQFGLAKSFFGLELYLASLKYFEDIVKQGSDHPYFTESVEGLLDVAEKLKDDLKTPPVIDGMYDDNLSAIEKMNPEVRQRIHFIIGKYAFNRGNMRDARDFLKTVKEGNRAYTQAQYMLGLIRLGVGRVDSPKPKYEEAMEHFENVRRVIPADIEDSDLRQLRDLASMGVARTEYEIAYLIDDGDERRISGLNRSIIEYKKIPRFSEAWGDALFERSWAHTVNNEYGKALGAMHSLEAPYFDEYFYPEADILRAIIYYYNCQWDRVNEILDATKSKYDTLNEHITGVLEQDLDFDQWYVLMQKSLEAGADSDDKELIPYIVAKALDRDPKYGKMKIFLSQLEKEADTFSKSAAFADGSIGRDMTDFAVETRDAFLRVIGKYVKTRLMGLNNEMESISTRASLVSLETKTAETDWLEQGRAIGGRARTRLPRPFVPDDTFQFWWFDQEYWIDELGYYEYKIKTECFE